MCHNLFSMVFEESRCTLFSCFLTGVSVLTPRLSVSGKKILREVKRSLSVNKK